MSVTFSAQGKSTQFETKDTKELKAAKDSKEAKEFSEINNNYQYEDNEVSGILRIKLQALNLRDTHIPNYAVGDAAFPLKRYLQDERDSLKEITDRTLLIPYNISGAHWVSLVFKINKKNVVTEIRYIDSLNMKNYLEDVEVAVREAANVYPELAELNITLSKGLRQEDGSSCGPLTIENLLAMALEKSNSDDIIVGDRLQDIRREHVKIYTPFDNTFYDRQRLNVDRAASFQQRREWTSNAGKFNVHELNKITQIIALLKKMGKSAIKTEVVKVFSAKDTKEHKEHLEAIRTALVSSKTHLTREQDDGFYTFIGLLFDIDKEVAKKSNFQGRFKIPYEAFSFIAESLELSEDNLDSIKKKLADQLKKDETFAKELQGKLFSESENHSKYSGARSFDVKLKSKATDPNGIICGLCDYILSVDQPIVKCDYDDSIVEDDIRFFHNACLENHFKSGVLEPFSKEPSLMRIDYAAVKPEELQRAICEFSKRQGKEIDKPVKAGNGKIYQQEDLEKYLKTAKTVLWKRVIVDKKSIAASATDLKFIKSLLKSNGYPDKSQTIVQGELDDIFTTVISVNHNTGAMLNPTVTKFEDFALSRPLREVFHTTVDGSGELRLQLKNAHQISSRFSFLSTKFSEESTSTTLWAYKLAAAPLVAAVAPAMVVSGVGYIGVGRTLFEGGRLFQLYEIGSSASGVSGALGGGAKNAITNPWVAVPAVALVGTYWFGTNKQRAFSETLQKAIDLYNQAIKENSNEKLITAERIVNEEFGEGEDGRYALTRAARWITGTPKDQYAFAHLLRAEIGLILQRDYCYQEFLQAFEDAENPILKAMSLLAKIKLLALNSSGPVPVSPLGRPYDVNERLEILEAHIKILNKDFKDIINSYFDAVRQGCQFILLNVRKDNLAKHWNEINQFLNFKDIPLLRYMEPHGKLFEILFTFMQGVCYSLCKVHDIPFSTIEKTKIPSVTSKLPINQFSYLYHARQKLETSWQLIQEFKLTNVIGAASFEGQILKEIKNYICRFFERCSKEKLFSDDVGKIMIELGLIEDVKKMLSESDILTIIKSSLDGADVNNLSSMEELLKLINHSDEVAKLKLNGNRNWLHYLPRIKVPQNLSKSMQTAIEKIMNLGISPYERAIDGSTAFMSIPSPDSLNIAAILSKEKGLSSEFIGMETQIDRLETFFDTVRKASSTKNSHFLLLSGPPGVGKTSVINTITRNKGFILKELKRADEGDMWLNQVESRVLKLFQEAHESNQHICLLFDEMDSICPEYQGPSIKGAHDPDKLVTIIQTQLDKLKGTKIVLIGATNYLSNIKPAIRNRAGVPVMFTLPSVELRNKIIEKELRLVRLENSNLILRLAEATSGWSHRLLTDFLNEVIKKVRGDASLSIKELMAEFEPMREVLKSDYVSKFKDKKENFEPPKLILAQLNDPYRELVALDNKIKNELDDLILFLGNTEAYTRRVKGGKNLLLCGPPGTGKTSFARAIANYCNALFINIEGGKYKIPGAEQKLSNIFDMAKTYEKAVIFIDEMDAISHDFSPAREILQTSIDGLSNSKTNVLVVIGATNFVDNISGPILNRFSQGEVPLPNVQQRTELFQHYINKIENTTLDEKLTKGIAETSKILAEKSEGLAPRDICKIIDNAVRRYTSEELKTKEKIIFNLDHILEALQQKIEEIQKVAARHRKGRTR